MGRGNRRWAVSAAWAPVLASVGLGCASAIPAASPKVTGEFPAYVFCERGLTDVFSLGIDRLCHRLHERGVDARAVGHGGYRAIVGYVKRRRAAGDSRPIVLVGHSHGADNVIRCARLLQVAGISVALVLTLDPVSPPPVPGNVERAYNIYWSQPLLSAVPVLRGTTLRRESGARTDVVNIDARTSTIVSNKAGANHFGMDDSRCVQDLLIRQVLDAALCKRIIADGPDPLRYVRPADPSLATAAGSVK